MSNKIKAVIWDMGGVILRTEDWKYRTQLAEFYNLTLKGIHDLVFNSDSAKRATLGEIDEKAHWKNLGEQLGLNQKELIDFQKRFWQGDQLDQDLVGFIRSLQTDLKTGLLSNAWSGARVVLTDSKPCIDAFHFSVFSNEVGLAKPNPAIYRYMLSLCEVQPTEAIFVDDAIENVEAANLLGIHGVHFESADQAVSSVEALLKDES